jgi:hypothetical protein
LELGGRVGRAAGAQLMWPPSNFIASRPPHKESREFTMSSTGVIPG